MTSSATASIKLNDGNTLPPVGFGTSGLKGEAGADCIATAIRNGFRLIDSAFNYENEGAVGAGVRRSGVPRAELAITSKLPGRHHAYAAALTTIEESLLRAGLDYYDLYLIHWPNPKTGLYVEAWQAMIEARKRGLIRSIGVCNFLPAHLEWLMSETGTTPAVNQVELHPYFPNVEQLAFDRSHGIVTESWSPMGRGTKIMNEPAVSDIARRLGRTPGQVLLRWHLELGALPLPKSTSPEHQLENLAIFDFELEAADVEAISALARPDGRLANQDPAVYEEF